MQRKNTLLVIFITFVATSALYLGAHILVPSLAGALNNIADIITPSLEGGGKIGEIQKIIENSFFGEPDKEKMETTALKSYVDALDDPYSEYFTKAEYESMSAQLTGNYKGVGIEVTLNDDNLITIINAYKNAPASKAGLMRGDIITHVDGIAVSGDNYNEAISMIRGDGEFGEKDSVIITAKRGGESFDAEVIRTDISVQTVDSHMIDGNIGYVSLTNFAEESPKDFELNVNSLISSGAKSLIIDLRNNPGGMLTSVVSIADYLLPKGIILTIKGKSYSPEVYYSDAKGIDLPMYVLINGSSASASEVLAGALSDHKKAVLIGEKTYGKGVVQTMYNLSDGDVLKITTARYYTPNDVCIDGKGIEPDHKVEMPLSKPLEFFTADEDIQLKKAIELIKE